MIVAKVLTYRTVLVFLLHLVLRNDDLDKDFYRILPFENHR